MGFFDDDSFEDIVKGFFGDNLDSQRTIKSERNRRIIDFIDTENKIYFVFELPGYNKDDISVKVEKKDLEVVARKKNLENVRKYLSQKLSQGISITRELPTNVKTKGYTSYFNNGVLEVGFNKK